MMDEATRPIMWNISHGWLMYVLFALAAGAGGWGFWLKIRRWRVGRPDAAFDRTGERILRLLGHAVIQTRTWRVPDAGLMHAGLFAGFAVLTAATTVVLIEYDLGLPVMRGAFYLYFQSLIVDLFGAAVMAGVIWAAWRRRPGGPAHLVRTREAWGLLGLIFVVCAGGFLVEGWRIAATADPWRGWSPVGNVVAGLSVRVMTPESLVWWHRVAWWSHLVFAFALIGWAPYTKLAHVMLAPLNIYAGSLDPIGASLKPIDFEKSERLGVNSLGDFTWKDLLDLDACTECGRCTAACPANRVGKPLSPRDIILGLRELMHERNGHDGGVGGAGGPGQSIAPAQPDPVIGAVPSTAPDALWACTTCAACVDACPVFIGQMPKIVDMRRFLVMEEADFPESLQAIVRSLESRGHPFPGTQATRVDWAAGLDIPEAASGANAETILWAGCAGALVERGQQVTRALAQLLRRSGVPFAILGREEKCTGDAARRIGHEFLFEQLARDNIATLARYGVRRIITACPHCLNTFRHEYPRLGGTFEVVHHSELLADLLREGRLRAPASTAGTRVTFHDPCYLGRQNGIFGPPRTIIGRATGSMPVEMTERRASSFCCGGGGGLSFAEEPPSMRVNQERARQALATGADIVATACPFCLTMLEDGIGATKGERSVRVADLAELLLEGQGLERASTRE